MESITVKADRHSWILDEQSVRPGGCSLVYRALRPDDPQQTPAALKTASPGNEASLLRERELLKALSARGGELPVVPFLDQGTWGARPFLVMPWFDENLETWVEDRRLPERLDVLAKAADAVDALHRTRHGDRTLVHSDLKPSNFLIEARGGGLRVLLADLGACRHLDPWASAGTRTAQHTLGFAPPEQALPFRLPARREWDLFALAATIYAVLAGEPPESTRAWRERMTDEGRRLERLISEQQSVEKERRRRDWDESLARRAEALSREILALQRNPSELLDIERPIYDAADRERLRTRLTQDLTGLATHPTRAAEEILALLDRHLGNALDPNPILRTTAPLAFSDACRAALRVLGGDAGLPRGAPGPRQPDVGVTVGSHAQATPRSPAPQTPPVAPTRPQPAPLRGVSAVTPAAPPAQPTPPPQTHLPPRHSRASLHPALPGIPAIMLLGAGLWGLLPRHDTVEREIVDPVPTRTEVVGMVTIPSSRPFQLAVLETSRAAFSALASLVDCDPSYGREAAMPATCVSFADALEFCNRATRALNEQNKGASVTEAYALQKGHWTWNPEASGYRLPTAGEWRLAAEALPKDQPLTRLAWFDQPISGGRFRTATLIPTTHGIHDLVGNAWEWVWPDDKTSLASTDPVQAMGGALFCPARVSAENPVKFAASADSVSSAKGLQDRSSAFGFRMARNVEEPTSRTEAVKVLRIPGLLTWLSLILGFVGVVGSLFLLKTRTRPS